MIVSIHQPAYLPWLGYFDRIAASDTFILLDNVQFEKNGFTNRNRIKTPRGVLWLTVPVLTHDHLHKALIDIEIDSRQNWKRKHLRSIEQNYCAAPYFSERFKRLVASYPVNAGRVAELCHDQLIFWLRELDISTRILRASDLPVRGHKSDLVLALCRQVGASTYLSGPLGRGYLEEEDFSAAGIEVRYQDYVHPQYTQLFGTFIPALSVVDYWLNCGDLGQFRSR